MQTLLAIDTSMNACTIALEHEGKIYGVSQAMGRGQSERFLPMILELLAPLNLELKDIDIFAATTGPGTFTGLRIGLSTMRALAQISGKPTRAISTFDALAAHNPNTQNLCILIETKRSDFYVRLPTGEAMCLNAQDLKNIIKPDWVLLGDATARALEEANLSNNTIEILQPSPEALINCAHHASITTLLTPVYLREADVSQSRQKTAIISQ